MPILILQQCNSIIHPVYTIFEFAPNPQPIPLIECPPDQQRMTCNNVQMGIEQVARWLKRTEGRDKLCKVLQYVCRFLAAHLHNDDYAQLMFSSLFESIRQARKLFRMFKSIDQYQAIVHLIFYGEEELTTLFQVISKALYFFYWAFDNLSVAAKVKLFQLDWQKFHRIGLKIRFVALLVSLFSFAYQTTYKPLTPMQRRNCTLKAAKNLFDLLPAGKDSGFLGKGLGQRLISVGGLTSALISTYQIFVEEQSQ